MANSSNKVSNLGTLQVVKLWKLLRPCLDDLIVQLPHFGHALLMDLATYLSSKQGLSLTPLHHNAAGDHHQQDHLRSGLASKNTAPATASNRIGTSTSTGTPLDVVPWSVGAAVVVVTKVVVATGGVSLTAAEDDTT